MKLKTSLIRYLLFLLPYFVTSQFMSNSIIWAIRYLGIIVFIFLFLDIIIKKTKIDFIDVFVILISSWLLIISIINHTLSKEIFYLIYSWFSVCFVANNSIKNSDYEFLKAFCYLLNISAIINIPYLIKDFNADAYTRIFIFGGKNQMQMFFLPAIFVNYALSSIMYGKIKKSYLFFIILDIITILICRASTGIFAIAVFGIFILFQKSINIRINIKHYIIFIVLALLLIFNNQYIEKIDFLNNFIVNILHKDLTFTARTKIWEYVFPFVHNNLFGYGYGNNLVNLRFPLLHECHNIFLELLLIGGLPLLILFCVFVIKLLKNNPNKTTNALLIMCFSFFVIGLTESVQFHQQFWITMICYYKISVGDIKIGSILKKEDICAKE